MISKDVIKTIAVKYQTTDSNVRREYLQHLFLSYFYQQPESEHIFFKGGTALRVIYQSPRFSEDLDFSSNFTDMRKIENAIQETLNAIEKEGILTTIKESKKTTGGYLAIIDFQMSGEIIAVQIEISLRQKTRKGETVTIAGTDLILPYIIIQLRQKDLVAEKIQALLTRKKPRDFYDLYFILRSNLLPAEEKYILPKTLRALEKTQINFERELKQFLPHSQWAIIRSFKTNLEKEIKRFI